MVDVLLSIGLAIAGTFIPLYSGLFLVKIFTANRANVRAVLAGVSLGILFWSFLDVMNEAALLGVSQGFSGGLSHLVLATLFGLGLAGLFQLEHVHSSVTEPAVSKTREARAGYVLPIRFLSYRIAAIAALGMGFHALGEGVIIGVGISSSESLIQGVGGLFPVVAYVLHKLLEGFTVATFAFLGGAGSPGRLSTLGAIVGLPTILGFFVGTAGWAESTYFFAVGGAGAIYGMFRLTPSLGGTRRVLVIITVLMGFYSMYLAALFHS